MHPRFTIPVLLLAASSVFAQPAPGPELLARVTQIALDAQKQLPDFISTQKTTRSEDDSGKGKKWKQRDTIETEFTFVNRKPSWKLTQFNGKPTKIPELRTGFRSDGILQFFSLPGTLFGPKAETAWEFVRWETRDGRQLAVYSLEVPQYASQLAFTGKDDRLVVGFHGLLFADAENAQVMRLEIQAELPADHPIEMASAQLDYAPVLIADQKFYLPARAVVEARILGRLSRNETEILRYQKYAAETKLKFDDN
ncbi:MAG TPA: hypothetical protein VGN17_17970 [Bryobacteraceae bacterium]|jgi:hypothetical protein